MKFGYTIIYVENVENTLAFYKKAFGLEQKMIAPGGDYAELESGSTTLAFASFQLGTSNFKNGYQKVTNQGQPWGVELVFVSENIEEDFETAIQAGAEVYESITQKPWGQKVGYLRDLNGFLIEICTQVST